MLNNREIEYKYGIDTTKLELGMIFKSYKDMRKFLNQTALAGASKQSQLKEWRRYIDWEKEGQQIIITDIYPTPLDKLDGRMNNGTQKYQKFIEEILLSYMTSEINKNAKATNNQNNDYQFLFTLNGIALMCKMINDKYIRKDIYKVLEDEGYTPFNIKDFFSRTELKFSLIINNALKNMEKRKLINYDKILIVKENGVQRTADFHDENEFLNMEKLTLTMMGLESVTQMFLRNKAKEYYLLLDKNVKKHLGWDGCYKVFAINLNSRSIDLEREYLEKTNQTNKIELNQNLVKFFNTQANNKFIKSCKDELNDFKLPADYKKQQYGLSDYLLKIEEKI